TETGMSVGTPTYMSPEQAMGSNVDGRSDQYSLGCVLYEMLAGQPPFDGNNTMAILAKHSMEAVPSLQVVRSSIPDDIEDAVMRALEKTPADRFRTMKEFAGALGMADISTAARRTPTRGNIRRTSGRVAAPPARRGPRRALVAGVLAVLVSAGGFLAWSQLGARDTPAAETGPDARRIAVMYFDSRGGDSLQFLADGLTDALIGELSRVKPLEVISRNGVAPYKNAPAAPDSVGRALRVGTLVTGDVAQSGGMLRVNVSMIDAGSGELITSTRIEKPRSELFALQDSIAAEVSYVLRIRIGGQIERRASRAGTRNAQAWELLQHAREEAAGIDRIIATGDTGAIAR